MLRFPMHKNTVAHGSMIFIGGGMVLFSSPFRLEATKQEPLFVRQGDAERSAGLLETPVP